MGERYGQNVEPKGTYCIEGTTDLPNWINGLADIKNPIIIQVTEETLISWKFDLSNKYKAKGRELSKRLMKIGYDAIITKYPDGRTGEIILFDNCKFMMV